MVQKQHKSRIIVADAVVALAGDKKSAILTLIFEALQGLQHCYFVVACY